MDGHQSLSVSVMICTWNNSASLRRTLQSFEECVVPENVSLEILVVDNNSTDDTQSVLAEFSRRLPLVCVFESKQGLAAARNTGISRAAGELLVFTDDDVRPSPNWIRAFSNGYSAKGSAYYLGGPVVSEFEALPPRGILHASAPWSVRGLDHGPQERALLKPSQFVGANWACNRLAVIQAGGFDTSRGLKGGSSVVRTGEESDLMRRLFDSGLRPYYLPEAVVHHWVPATKCTARHIGARLEASCVEKALDKVREDPNPFIFSLQSVFRLLPKLARSWMELRLAQLGQDVDTVAPYLRYRRLRGQFRGFLVAAVRQK